MVIRNTSKPSIHVKLKKEKANEDNSKNHQSTQFYHSKLLS